MPRRRSISCNHCGFMQLKRDDVCDGCGRMTQRAKRSMHLFAAKLLIIGGVVTFSYWQITSAVSSL